MWLFFLFVAVPIIEIALFIEVGGWVGLWPTIAIVILTALIGTALLRVQGVGAMTRLQQSIQHGDDPRGPLAHGAMILFAGALLLTPGFFTDAVGFALLLPPVRAALIAWVGPRLKMRAEMRMHAGAHMSGQRRPTPAQGDTIEGDFEPVDPDDGARRSDPNAASGWTRKP